MTASGLVDAFDRYADAIAGPLRGNRFADRCLYGLSEAANHSMVWHGLNAVDAAIGGPRRRRAALRRSVILAVEQALVNGLVKAVFGRSRPEFHGEPTHRLRTPRTSSFPSGHASAAACAATLLSDDLGMAPLWWCSATAVSWSRIHVGVHHGSDVVGGLVTGRILALVAGRLWPADAMGSHGPGTRRARTNPT